MDSANVTCTTANLLSQMLTTKLFAMHLAMIGFRKLRVVWRSITLTYLDKYEYWKVKCVKSVLGEFSSGVSICHKKVLSQIWGPLFARLPPARGYGAPFLRLWLSQWPATDQYGPGLKFLTLKSFVKECVDLSLVEPGFGPIYWDLLGMEHAPSANSCNKWRLLAE